MDSKWKKKLEELYKQVADTGKLPDDIGSYEPKVVNALKAIRNSAKLNYGRGLPDSKKAEWEIAQSLRAELGVISWCPECESTQFPVNYYAPENGVHGWYCGKCAPKNIEPISRQNLANISKCYGELFNNAVKIANGSYVLKKL